MRKQQASCVNPKFTFDEDCWVVSVLNTGKTRFSFGHAIIVVEGFYGEKLFVGQYDVLAKKIKDQTVISEVRCFQGDKYRYPKPYSSLPSRSWLAECKAVFRMLVSIRQDCEQTEKALQGKADYIPYSFVGSNHFLFKLFQDSPNNCADWCREKLKIGVPGVQFQGTGKPKLLAGIQTGRGESLFNAVRDGVVQEVEETISENSLCVIF